MGIQWKLGMWWELVKSGGGNVVKLGGGNLAKVGGNLVGLW